jgi:hypothetical protein
LPLPALHRSPPYRRGAPQGSEGCIVTREEWVERALDAAVEQGHAIPVTDPAALDAIADVLAHADRKTTNTTAAAS